VTSLHNELSDPDISQEQELWCSIINVGWILYYGITSYLHPVRENPKYCSWQALQLAPLTPGLQMQSPLCSSHCRDTAPAIKAIITLNLP
jgi:hypothetical protein